MQEDLECVGRVRLGALSADLSDRLAQFSGNWLEFSPAENAIVVRHVQPAGCPALAAIPCELITIMERLPTDVRDAMSGGELFCIGGNRDQLVRLSVEKGEIRIQWAHPDYSEAVPASLEDVMQEINPRAARVNGSARFSGPAAAAGQLQDFIDSFEGLYPEGELNIHQIGDQIQVHFFDANVGPQELIDRLKVLATPSDSLDAELDLSSFAPTSQDHLFRIYIRQGWTEVLRPSLWKRI